MPKVAVAMSGGVDSGVAAALLKEQGYEVIGLHFDLWTASNLKHSSQAKKDVKKVAKQLGIKLEILDLKQIFKDKIVSYFIDSYQKGRTPNPCVHCNKLIKFGSALKKAKELGADYLATGHYARLKKDKTGLVHLYENLDTEKDQTYFMNQLSQAQLKHLIFPLAELTKLQVRKIAKKYGLASVDRKESQDLCFLAKTRVDRFLAQNLKVKTGSIKDFDSQKTLGQHNGLINYTLGQRRGIGLGAGPWFVAGIDHQHNTLWVTADEALISKKELTLQKVNWLSGQEPHLPLKTKCRIRYRSKAVPAELSKAKNHYLVKFAKPQRAIAPGQYAVFYHRKECLGGGEII